MTVWPSGLWKRIPAGSAAYRATGILMAALGTFGVLLLAVTVVFAAGGILALLGPEEGWSGLIAAVTFMIAAIALVGGLGLAMPAHAALGHWRTRDEKAWPWVRGFAVALVLVGATFWISPFGLGDTTPLSRFLMAGRLGLLAAGAVLLAVGARGRPDRSL